jgi:predicted nucleotidyltransferase
MPTADDLMTAADLTRIRSEVARVLDGMGVRAWLFGSHAAGTARRSSDVDVAVQADGGPVPAAAMLALRESLDEAPVLRRVDLVDLATVDPEFAARVLSESIPWIV